MEVHEHRCVANNKQTMGLLAHGAACCGCLANFVGDRALHEVSHVRSEFNGRLQGNLRVNAT
eukprot:5400182-Amphidinium_carterae.1